MWVANFEVQLGGLYSLTMQHDAMALELAGDVGRAGLGPACQASVAAVSSVQAAVDAMAVRLAARASNSGAKVDTAARAFGEQEHSSVAAIAATYPGVIL